ncbi:glycosyltransferase [Methylotenera sp.]|uniref:glycosyltransferase n=1 Tax=Methylotenera sp. TaxID=2051956 RepID=UPI0027252253|nr:hypothetical protein [Methylotenera sp.]MDO9204852.1 hypothetical protein [Methylotenera sp.]MDO9394859.1 hypothetical protein [Methylotenera sp.]MDP1522634.1 hypothetical protein [Methylotenera sp.]MDP2071943.1 hypothetical protein [Methylotenera sp.]MDP2230805.1 hypothetical protein [Methylotenera sp.]
MVDAVVDGETGILHQPKSIEGIKQALLALTNNADLRAKNVKTGYGTRTYFFTTDILVNTMRKYYQNLLGRPSND